ncbi:MAG TPA: EpsI family protein, partial [Burkholderiales bacterium]|nr:EpsI family protein [Burkholderiales bacterium]
HAVTVSGRDNKQFNPLAPVSAGALVVVIIGGASAITNNTPYALRSESPSKLPVNLRGWTPTSPQVQWTRDTQQDIHLLQMVFRKDRREIDVLIVEAGSPNAKLPKPHVVTANSEAWHEGHTRKETICAQAQCRALLHTTWQSKGQDPRHVYYNYRIGGFETTSELALRAAHGWHRLTRSAGRPRLIALTSSENGHAPEELVAAFAAFESLLHFGSPNQVTAQVQGGRNR